MNFALGRKQTTAAPSPAPGGGLRPSSFALQGFTRGQPVGFGPGSETLQAQTQGMTPASASTPSSSSSPVAGQPSGDMWEAFGPFGAFFRTIASRNPKFAELAQNPQFRDALQSGSSPTRVFETPSG